MPHQTIVINSSNDMKPYENETLYCKELIVNADVKDVKLGILTDCVVKGGSIVCKKLCCSLIMNVKSICADEIEMSTFKDCNHIQCGDIDESYNITKNQFESCNTASIVDSKVSECIFDGIETLFLTNTDVSSCNFKNITCNNDFVISMEDGFICDVSFENINLKNDSYLIEGFGSPWVSDCVFMNIQTSREDNEIFLMEETKGKIFKKKIQYEFVDTDSCSGLDSVMGPNGFAGIN